MILIADSGASKTDWRMLHNGKVEQAQTLGFNPYYQPEEQLDREIREVLLPQIKNPVKEIYYYGTGCSSDKNRQVIRNVMQRYFADAYIEVWHDLEAAARALCGHEEGIACILGTGANSCYYDGKKIVENVTSLGYVLGDEGSGAWMGKRIIADYLRKDLPPRLWDQFKKRFPMSKDEILSRVYSEDMPGRFLGSFSHFIFQHLREPYCYKLVYDGFAEFFEKNVCKYERATSLPVHFTGSVAFYFSDVLRQAGSDKGLRVGRIVESPIAGLTLYHQKA
ncbi:MAG: N-acetylglucosamine kinase [Cyclobacteriaceae bacterium]|nr:N-acetylglucosamine kinase [Cyclobacteriaceae bacterium]MCX7638127.1 N-acetylglucosamine kinase [Cyclobacteriaceae bacterium]MDW8330965.1 N-acetylglucosamine kinase [Cyclobacteriaceae bacterium]